jgi:hypothetical protein
MANEFQQMPNPDNVPGPVTSGYQRQNTNMFALQTGLDTTEPYDNGSGVITVPAGGIVEVNGVMFKIVTAVTLNKPVASRAYWIEIADNGNGTASATPVTRPGAWDSAKQGCYTSGNRRTLNWVSLGAIADPAGLAEAFSLEVKGARSFRLPKGWYYAVMKSGKGGGNGGDGSNSAPGGSGNGGAGAEASPSAYKTLNKIFFYDGSGNITVKTGGDGGKGGNGGKGGSGPAYAYGAGGGGGGSGRGEETSITVSGACYTTGEQPGGNGGNGGNAIAGSSSTNTAGGGGGGGGEKGGSGGKGITGAGGGKHGDGGGSGGGGGGSGYVITPGGSGGAAGGQDGGNGSNAINNLTYDDGNGGGGGGGMGAHGSTRADGDPAAGSCAIYRVQN